MRLVAVLVVAMALPAAAAPPAAAPDPAREHYERGLAKYNLAEFDAAIVEFKQSYELSKAPRLLFNIAQAYRLKKDWESALYFYSTYLRADPNPPNLDDVESKIDEMKRALDEQHRAGATVAGGGAGTTTVETKPPPRRRWTATGGVLAAVGVGTLAIGGGLLGLASQDATTLHRVATGGMPWTPEDQAKYDEGSRSQTAGIVMLSVGGALTVGGTVVLVLALTR